MSTQDKGLAVLTAGGPAPGLNTVLAGVIRQALRFGYPVFGIEDGFRYLPNGLVGRYLTIKDAMEYFHRGGSFLGNKRDNPRSKPNGVSDVVKTLTEAQLFRLVTIGGDDTLSSAAAVAEASKGRIQVIHVPKTIDNDLPLPDGVDTFGYNSAVDAGVKETIELALDAATLGDRWFVVVTMGRKAGFLAAEIGFGSQSPLTVIPEYFPHGVSLNRLAEIAVGTIVKQHTLLDRRHGCLVFAEGLLDLLIEGTTCNGAPQGTVDEHGNTQFAKLHFAAMLAHVISRQLEELGLSIRIYDREIGYGKPRVGAPLAIDVTYALRLGAQAVNLLAQGRTCEVALVQGSRFGSIPFAHLVDPTTGRAAVRSVDLSTDTTGLLKQWMGCLVPDDISNQATLECLAQPTKLTPREFAEQFREAAAFGT